MLFITCFTTRHLFVCLQTHRWIFIFTIYNVFQCIFTYYVIQAHHKSGLFAKNSCLAA
jgi:hypothetical protein